jgi:hypothetical protein
MSLPVSSFFPSSPSNSGSDPPNDFQTAESPSNDSNGVDIGYNSHHAHGDSADQNIHLLDEVLVPQSFPSSSQPFVPLALQAPNLTVNQDDIPYGELIIRSKKKPRARERDSNRIRSRSDADKRDRPVNLLNVSIDPPVLSHSSSPEDSPLSLHHQLVTTGATANGGSYEILRIERPSPPRSAGNALVSGSESDSEASIGNGFSQKSSLNANNLLNGLQNSPLPLMPTTPSRPIGSPGTYKRSPPPPRNAQTPGHHSSASIGSMIPGMFSPGPGSGNRPPYPPKPGTAMGRRRAGGRDGTSTAAPSRRGSTAMGFGSLAYVYSGPMTEDEPEHLEPVTEKEIENWTEGLDPWNESAESMFQSDNIAVCVRLRPDRDRRDLDENAVWQVTDFSITERNGGSPIYYFSRVFKPDASTIKVYEKVALPIVQQFLQGYNGTVFAYGQTGSGVRIRFTRSFSLSFHSSFYFVFLSISEIFHHSWYIT